MTPRDIFNKYLGWCPRFNSSTVLFQPYTELPIGGKLVFLTLVSTWGLLQLLILIHTQEILSLNLEPILYSMNIVINTFRILSGVVLLTLLTDFFLTGKVVKRHRVELSILLCSIIPDKLSPTLFRWYSSVFGNYLGES